MTDDHKTDLAGQDPAKTETPASNTEGRKSRKNFIEDLDIDFGQDELENRARLLWDGKESLLETFWFYLVGPLFVLNLLGAMTYGIVSGFFDLVAILWAGFMVVPVLRAAGKYTGDRLWANLARVAVLLIALGVLLGFLRLIFS